MAKQFFLIFAIMGWGYMAFAQHQDSTRSQVQEDLERALEDFDPEDPQFDTERLTQYLQDLASNPININKADTDALLQIPGINLKVARSVVEYREKTKPFENVEELVKVKGVGKVTLEKMRPYVTVGSGLELKKTLYTNYRYWTHDSDVELWSRFQQTLQKQEGYRRPDSLGGYTGSPVKYYQKLRYKSDHLSVNVTQEKDPGEPLSSPVNFDYTSWHLALQENGNLQDLVLGDYSLSFGQGLILWNGGTFGKGREVIGAASRNGRGVSPYTSSQETDYYRGIAATYGSGLQATGFYSYRRHGASILAADTTRFPRDDGFHRTGNERSRFKNLRQELYGGHLSLELPVGVIGATGYKTKFSKYIGTGTAAYNQYDFTGTGTSALGLDYKFLLGTAVLFGEAGRSENGGLGLITGIERPIGDHSDITIAYRNYAKDFQSIMGDGFGEASGEPQNERGIYLGIRHALNNQITLSAYVDQYRFPAARFGTTQATSGFDWLVLAEVKLSRDLQFYLQARSEVEDDEFEQEDSFGRLQRRLGRATRSSLRSHLDYWVNPNVRLRTRGEVVRSRQAGEKQEYGYLMYQDVRVIPGRKWKIDGRVTVYDTKSYASRVYQFENDLLYVLSNTVLFNQGQRFYLLLNYEPWGFMEVWAKFGITIYEDLQRIGSGLNEIQGNKRSELGLQVRFKI